ncbi:MAG: polysaccharide biosynthesis protein [Acidobacteriota bacterium]|nr:polysaccharide biosynthesis protein [Acidobacteriota bacterium]
MLRYAWRWLLGRAYCVVLVAASLVGAFLLRFDFSIPRELEPLVLRSVGTFIVVKIVVFHFVGLCPKASRVSEPHYLRRTLGGNFLGSVLAGLAARLVLGDTFPRSIFLIDFLLCLVAIELLHFVPIRWKEHRHKRHFSGKMQPVLIYGAGTAGMALVRELRVCPELGYSVAGFIDDDPRLVNSSIIGVPVLGIGRQAASIVEGRRRRGKEVSAIIIAIASTGGREFASVMANCRVANIPTKVVPGMAELLSGEVISRIRDVSVNEMLNRNPVQLDETKLRASIEGKAVMVTGAAGSIGSELCRQLARFRPSCLAIFDQAESELFKIDRELRDRYPNLNILCQLGDIRDPPRIMQALEESQAVSIYHAAAYKHVPMIESHVLEAVRNNIIGTWNLVCAAKRKAVQSFVMISTDKAVNPTSLMGTTKRICELIVAAAANTRDKARFVSVRFGNVLGSNGSVVHTFRAQIAAGGPVKVTHPDMRRYFMTIPEAVMLTLQASTMGQGTEIFVLDMGEPVKIVDLARNMIRLAGLVPDEDIEIQFIGLRPGEKLFEEIKLEGENILPTYHEKIRIFGDLPVDWDDMMLEIAEVQHALASRSEADTIRWMSRLVPEYEPKAWKSCEDNILKELTSSTQVMASA